MTFDQPPGQYLEEIQDRSILGDPPPWTDQFAEIDRLPPVEPTAQGQIDLPGSTKPPPPRTDTNPSRISQMTAPLQGYLLDPVDYHPPLQHHSGGTDQSELVKIQASYQWLPAKSGGGACAHKLQNIPHAVSDDTEPLNMDNQAEVLQE